MAETAKPPLNKDAAQYQNGLFFIGELVYYASGFDQHKSNADNHGLPVDDYKKIADVFSCKRKPQR